jgi:hypothetical protein
VRPGGGIEIPAATEPGRREICHARTKILGGTRTGRVTEDPTAGPPRQKSAPRPAPKRNGQQKAIAAEKSGKESGRDEPQPGT